MLLRTRLRWLSDAANQVTIVVCAVLIVIMLALSAIGIFMAALASIAEAAGVGHWFINGPLAWAYDNTRSSVVRLFLPWLGMLSITVAFKYGEHIAILALAHAMPGWAYRVAQGLNLFAIAFFGAALVWYGFEFAVDARHLYIVSDSIQISHRWTAASVPVAGLILCLHLADGVALLDERHDANVQPIQHEEPAFEPDETPSHDGKEPVSPRPVEPLEVGR